MKFAAVFIAILIVTVNVGLFCLAWPSIRAHKLKRRLKKLDRPVLKLSDYQREMLEEKLEDERIIRGIE